MEKWLGESVPKLGFGMMRLPMAAENQLDIPQIEQMVDLFLENGFTYFDTAYGYLNEQSEPTVGRALVGRHPRDRFLLATKLPIWHLKAPGDPERIFNIQLERTQAGYFDYYLLHSISGDRRETLDTFGAWDFLKRIKAEGLARHIGFSFHDKADVLDAFLTDHPEVEFVQLQINYADWEDENVQSRQCYEVARRHGKSVVIMEPVKGGALAGLTDEARAVLEAARPGKSPASWAMRYAASLEGVVTVLSGMSTLAQMEDNIATLRHFEPLTAKDREAIEKVREILLKTPTTPCTDCKYCTENCPKDIPIPNIIRVDNRRRVYNVVDKGSYAFNTRGHGRASDCIACGVCESRCPQHIQIIQLLKDCAAVYE